MTLPPRRRPAAPRPEPVPGLAVGYEDADIVVVDKPAGVAAHPTPGWTGPTVLQGLLAGGHQIATSGAAERQGIVHRLDANTTGLMVVAKSEHAYSVLKQAFRDREVDKRYHALVQGHPDPLRGTIDAPIARHPAGDGRFAVVADGRPAVTHYDTLEAFRAASLIEIKLETGRTHQIRVHMAAVGIRAWATGCTAPTRCSRPGSASPGSGCTPSGSGSRTPPTAAGWSSPAATRPIWPPRSSFSAPSPGLSRRHAQRSGASRCPRRLG